MQISTVSDQLVVNRTVRGWGWDARSSVRGFMASRFQGGFARWGSSTPAGVPHPRRVEQHRSRSGEGPAGSCRSQPACSGHTVSRCRRAETTAIRKGRNSGCEAMGSARFPERAATGGPALEHLEEPGSREPGPGSIASANRWCRRCSGSVPDPHLRLHGVSLQSRPGGHHRRSRHRLLAKRHHAPGRGHPGQTMPAVQALPGRREIALEEPAPAGGETRLVPGRGWSVVRARSRDQP